MSLSNLSIQELRQYKDYIISTRLKGIVERNDMYDYKFAYHLVRLAYESEMILLEEDLDLRKNREHLKSIRRGDVPEKDIKEWFSSKEKYLEQLYQTSKLRHKPEVSKIRDLLMSCLEQHYGSLSKVFVKPNLEREVLKSIKDILDKVNL